MIDGFHNGAVIEFKTMTDAIPALLSPPGNLNGCLDVPRGFGKTRIPVIVDERMPPDQISFVSHDGKRELGRIINLEIHVTNNVTPKMELLDFAKVENKAIAAMAAKSRSVADHAAQMAFYGKREITGRLICNFINNNILHDYMEAMDKSRDSALALSDAYAFLTGFMTKKNQKIYLKRRRRIAADIRRSRARRARKVEGRATF